MKTGICVALVFILVLLTAISWSQTAGPTILKEPLAPPKYLTVIQTDNPATLLKTVSETVKKAGFQIDQLDSREQILDASKKDGGPSKNYDRVIIWLERDFQ